MVLPKSVLYFCSVKRKGRCRKTIILSIGYQIQITYSINYND